MYKENLTICFYENPGALMEIKAWENLKFKQIVRKIVNNDYRFYQIKLDSDKCGGYSTEHMICIDIIGLLSIPDLKKEILNYLSHCGVFVFNSKNEKVIDYYKTIVFGKLTSVLSQELSRLTFEFEILGK